MPDCLNHAVTPAAPQAQSDEDVSRAADIFARYGDSVRAMILFNVDNEAEADDIYQDLFLSLVRKPVPPGIEDIKGYLYRAIVHDVLDSIRRVKGYQARLARYAGRLRFKAVEEGPERPTLRREEAQRILQLAEEELPPHQAEAVIQRYWHGHSISDAAMKMGVSERSFSRYLCIGLKKIRNLISDKLEDDERESG
ncbi:MAG: RNA polymerase sigma factor [Planctomycetota bacterium]|jgi:RNA polymerase sigma factor (sigma-70 family)